MTTAVLAYQDAVKTALDGAAAVTDLLGGQGRVFDETPTNAALPYAYFGAANRVRREEAVRAWTVRLRLFVVTDEAGRIEGWTIADAIADALDGQELALAEPFVAADITRAVQAGDVIEPGSDKTVFVDLQTTIEQH